MDIDLIVKAQKGRHLKSFVKKKTSSQPHQELVSLKNQSAQLLGHEKSILQQLKQLQLQLIRLSEQKIRLEDHQYLLEKEKKQIIENLKSVSVQQDKLQDRRKFLDQLNSHESGKAVSNLKYFYKSKSD